MIKIDNVIYRVLTKNELKIRNYVSVGATDDYILYYSECEYVATRR